MHLRDVSRLAESYAAPFGASDWARLIGHWHDLGKYRTAFQQYLRAAGGHAHTASEETAPGRVDHSTVGALMAMRHLGDLGKVAAYVIAGHHAGMPDAVGDDTSLEARLSRQELLSDLDSAAVPADILSPPIPTSMPPSRDMAEFHVWVRMLFSCLVDADFLATEQFMDPGRAAARSSSRRRLVDLLPDFDHHMATAFPTARTPVQRARAEVQDACVRAAKLEPGLFSLTVPTGGGKTLASVAFALHHARHWNKRRLVYAIPYTSIVEQTADTLRAIFGDEVLEHHSNLDPDDDDARGGLPNRLAAENWDAPIVVTTNVQLFESLFAARASRCRKLHRLVDSIVVLDEAQLLPPAFLEPILHAIRALSRNYGVTFLFTTATQPALGLPGVREIAPDAEGLARALQRVRFEWRITEPHSWEDVADEARVHASVLCVVDRRDDARTLATLMAEDTVHLSALMCGAHRSEVIESIKGRLASGTPTRVVSTQLVEAGVDLDFPVVYRAFAGLDSIAQAAGRCNREGRLLPGMGRVVIFRPPRLPPPGHLRKAAETTEELFSEGTPTLLSPGLFSRYFDLFYRSRLESLDRHGILQMLARDAARGDVQFREAARRFRLVDDSSHRPVLVTWGAGARVAEQFRRLGPSAGLRREAQRFVVNVPLWQLQELLASGAIVELESAPGLFVQLDSRIYHPQYGLVVSARDPVPEDLIA